MKLRNIFTMLAAALAFAFVGCQEEERFLEEVQVSQSMVTLAVEGDSQEIAVKTAGEWVIAGAPEWLTVNPTSGNGSSNVTFSAEATKETREAVLALETMGVTQMITVLQMAEKVDLPFTDCATVLKEKEVGKVYKVKGTVTDLTNYDKYGCFYVNDGTGEVYVYGSMNPTAYKPEVGDIISFEGPWTSYGNFDDVTIIGLEKSLIKLEKVISTPLPLDGGVATVLLTVKDGDFVVEIPEDAAWLTAGEPSAVGGMTCVELTAAANEGGARTTTVTFKTTVDGKDYFAMADIEQYGAIAEVSVKDFLAAEIGTSLYKLTGKVANLKAGNYGNFDLVDATGSVYVYGLTATPVSSNDQSFPTLGIKEGDIVTLIGTRADFKGTAQVGGPAYYVSHEGHTEATVAEFLAKETGDAWYKLSGTVTNLQTGDYGNFDLVDETGSVYVYGLTVAPVAKNDKSFPKLGIKEGDKVTLIGKRAVHNGTAQVGGPAYYISHEAAGSDEPEQPAEPETPSTGNVLSLTNAEICAAMTSSETSYQDYTIESASGVWTVNASKNNANTFLQCRGKKGAYIKTPAFDKEIKYVTLHFSEAKSVYADNVFCVFPSTWTAPTEDAAYPEDGNVGRAVTDGSYTLKIPVNAGNKQVSISIIRTNAYYIDHIDVEF